MNDAEAHIWEARGRATIRALWLARHTNAEARNRIHFWIRVVRLSGAGHHYRSHKHMLTAAEIGAGIEAILDRQAKD